MKRNNLILFGTYWNEKDWIKPSLEQIEKLNPKEVILCDGCFDTRKVNKSTDGTREIIKKWCSKRKNARMISAVRVSRLKALYLILKSHNKNKWYNALTPSRLKAIYITLTENMYRINQALTFQKMISLSKTWNNGDWFMSYDADQFYTDDMIKQFMKYINTQNNYGLLIGTEHSFLENFTSYTDKYEKRKYNNMPHKIYKNTNIVPTRGLVLESWILKRKNATILKSDYYENIVEKKDVGIYNHYKLPLNKQRYLEGHKLGNRKMVNTKKYKYIKMNKPHPKIISKRFKV